MKWQIEEAANAMGKSTKPSQAEKCTQEDDYVQTPIDSLISALKHMSKRNDGNFYPSVCYYNVIQWIRALKKGAIFRYNKERNEINWDF